MPGKFKPSPFTPETFDEVDRLTKHGWTAKRIAEQLGLKPEQIGSIKGALTRRRIAAQQLIDGGPKFQKPQANTNRTKRKCLVHGGVFMSDGKHNRICPQCHGNRVRNSAAFDQEYSVVGGQR